MRFNTGQLQELAEVRREQLRHWRKVLPPLAGRDGRTDDYAFSEVLALAVVATLVDRLGISVSRVCECAADLFALFADNDDPASLPDRIHVAADGRLTAGPEPGCEVFATVKVPEVLGRVRGRLAPEQRRQLLLPLGR